MGQENKKGRPDGLYEMAEIIDSLGNDFINEKALCDYIEEHIVEFCTDCLCVDYYSHKREYPLSEKYTRRKKGNKRIDFLIITKDNQRIGIECKTPQFVSELSYAIGQALTYLTLFELHGHPLSNVVIVSTKIDSCLPFVVDKYSLPITFIAFDKQKFLIYQNASTRRK